MVELLYFMMLNQFVFDKYADKVHKYIVKKLCQTTRMDVFEAFRYMVFLVENSDDALTNIKNNK